MYDKILLKTDDRDGVELVGGLVGETVPLGKGRSRTAVAKWHVKTFHQQALETKFLSRRERLRH